MLRNALRHENADHVPVLADEVRELLAVQPGETVIDGTFGAGGHAALLAADLVLLAIGEPWLMSGEGASRASLDVPGRQMELAALDSGLEFDAAAPR